MHAPYFRLWPAPLYNVFPFYLINGMIIEKKLLAHEMCVLIFSTPFVRNTSHSKQKRARYDKNVYFVRVK
jgi:hypothetical protein